MVYSNIWGYLESVLTVKVNREHSIGDPRPDTTQHLSSGSLLTDSDVEKALQNLAEILTNQLRTDRRGDNGNSSTVNGVAFVKEAFISVRWQVAYPPGCRDIPHGCFTALEHSYHSQDTVA